MKLLRPPVLVVMTLRSIPGVSQNSSTTLHSAIDSLVGYFNSHAALVVVIWFILFLARFVKLLSGLVYAQRIRHYRTSPAPGDWQQRLNQLLQKLQMSRPVAFAGIGPHKGSGGGWSFETGGAGPHRNAYLSFGRSGRIYLVT